MPQSPAKSIKKRSKQKDSHAFQQLTQDFFRTALAETHCEELEKAQL